MTAMLVTADGAVRFTQVRSPESHVTVAISRAFRPLEMSENAAAVAVTMVQRVYELYERSADLLVYREVVQ